MSSSFNLAAYVKKSATSSGVNTKVTDKRVLIGIAKALVPVALAARRQSSSSNAKDS
ncbi:hypothetical protein SAMN05445060_2810 [Williamsia sterculiae]|uniref:Uncharacterized protein n=1 Tax=Williamsia sterculiae TaxID=1344003 RepID=A0A1N7GI18_9NOCA|nr:hypothetical protein SAMN05445060_2810 [Williamsia sterculiae]